MKKMKRFFAVILSLAMVLGMSMTAFGATKNSATITVKNAADDATLTYAQVIVADQTTETGWDFVDDGVATAYVNAFGAVDAQAAIKMLTDDTASAAQKGLAQANAAGYVTFKTMANPQPVTSAGVYLVKATETGYTYNIMAAYVGFATVEDDGTTYDYPSLIDTELDAKKTPIQVTKAVIDTDNVTQTGATLTYTITTNVPFIAPTDSDKTFWVYDELTGATYKKVATVKLGDTDVTDDHAVVYDGQKFSVDLSDLIDNANSNAGKAVVIKYTVTVTAENDTITNTAKAGHKNGEQYGSDTTTTYEGNITLTKTNTDNETLPNAKFEVRRKSQSSSALNFILLDDGSYKYVPAAVEGKTTTTLVTDSEGKIKVIGLDLGIYYFKEIEAPKGYSVNTTDADATLALTAENSKDGVATEVITATAYMSDSKLSSLPSTGGIGTTIFTIAGCAIMIAAAGFFFASRKKANR